MIPRYAFLCGGVLALLGGCRTTTPTPATTVTATAAALDLVLPPAAGVERVAEVPRRIAFRMPPGLLSGDSVEALPAEAWDTAWPLPLRLTWSLRQDGVELDSSGVEIFRPEDWPAVRLPLTVGAAGVAELKTELRDLDGVVLACGDDRVAVLPYGEARQEAARLQVRGDERFFVPVEFPETIAPETLRLRLRFGEAGLAGAPPLLVRFDGTTLGQVEPGLGRDTVFRLLGEPGRHNLELQWAPECKAAFCDLRFEYFRRPLSEAAPENGFALERNYYLLEPVTTAADAMVRYDDVDYRRIPLANLGVAPVGGVVEAVLALTLPPEWAGGTLRDPLPAGLFPSGVASRARVFEAVLPVGQTGRITLGHPMQVEFAGSFLTPPAILTAADGATVAQTASAEMVCESPI